MRTATFVRIARALRPPTKELIAAGLNKSDVASIEAIYRLPKRIQRLSKWTSKTALHRLISNYDTHRFAFSALQFSAPKHTRQGIRFAHREADPLFVSGSGPVVLLDHVTDDAEIVADTGDSFLDALAFLLKVRANNQPASFKATLEQVLKLAGSKPRRHGFWRSITVGAMHPTRKSAA